MSFTLPALDMPVVKISNHLLAPTELEQRCICCSQYADACPASPLPQQSAAGTVLPSAESRNPLAHHQKVAVRNSTPLPSDDGRLEALSSAALRSQDNA